MAVKIPALLHKMSQSAQKAWYKKNNMEMPSTSAQTGGKSAAAAKRVKVAPRKASEVKPDSVRAINAARQAAYMAKGGRQPIGAMGSGGSNVMAGGGQSTIKDLKASIKAGFNPKVSLDPYESERAKKTGPRSLKLKKESVNEAKKPDASMVMTDQLKKKMISDKDKQTLGKVAALMASAKNKDKKNAYVRQVGLKAMKAGKVDPARGHSPTRFGREALRKEEVEQIDEGSKRMSAAIKLQRAFDREKVASDASRKRGEEVLAQARAEYAKKQAAKTNEEVEQVDEGAKEDAEKLLGGSVKEKPKMPPGKQPAGYRYVRGLARKAMKAGMKKEEVEQVDEVDYKKYLKVSQEKRPLTPSAVDAAMSAEKEGNPNPARKLRNTQDARKFANKQLTKQVAKTRPAQKFPVYEPGRKYVGDSVELDGPVIDENNLKSLKKEDTEMKYIEEKLTAADPASKWISDFVKSDNPKFAGKSKKERIQQALGAYYAAKRGTNEEVEQIDELKDTTLKSYVKKANKEMKSAYKYHQMRYGGRDGTDQEYMKKAYPAALAKYDRREAGVEKAKQKLAKEEVGGKTPETDTEVSLAKMHGNPKKITYGDVVKARIASAKKKALNKG